MRKTKTAEAEEAKAEAAATATAQQQREKSEKKKEQQREKNKTTTTSEIKIKKKKNKNKKRKESSSSLSFVQRHVVVPITDVFRAIKSMNYRQLTLQLLSLTLIVTSALMIWKSLCLYTHSESPVVVVLSGSMEPAFKRGDILFLSLKKKEKKTNKRMSFSDNSNSIVGGGGVATTTTTKKKKNEEEEERGEEERTRVGEIIVFSIDGREIPIVHRVIKSHYHPYSTASLSSSSSSSSSQSSFDKADDDSSGSGSIGSGSGSSYDDSGRDDENSSLSSPSPSFKHEMLTKGDNNYMDDIGLYAPGQKWLNEKHVMGRTVGYLPHVGKATILMNDHPMIKYALILVLGLLVISGKEG
jgi:signal peptidase